MSIKSKALTAKQEAFAQAVSLNMGDKVAAYKTAGYSLKMSASSICVESDRLYNSPKISPRIKELELAAKDKLVERFTVSLEERLKRLDDLYHMGVEEVVNERGVKSYQNLSVAKQSLEVLNTMLGISEKGTVKPVKVQVGVVDAS